MFLVSGVYKYASKCHQQNPCECSKLFPLAWTRQTCERIKLMKKNVCTTLDFMRSWLTMSTVFAVRRHIESSKHIHTLKRSSTAHTCVSLNQTLHTPNTRDELCASFVIFSRSETSSTVCGATTGGHCRVRSSLAKVFICRTDSNTS